LNKFYIDAIQNNAHEINQVKRKIAQEEQVFLFSEMKGNQR